MATLATKRAFVPLDKKPKAATSLMPLIEMIAREMRFPFCRIHLLSAAGTVSRRFANSDAASGNATPALLAAIANAKGSVVHQWDHTGALDVGIALLDELNRPFALLQITDERDHRWTDSDHDRFVGLAQSVVSQVRWFTRLEQQLFDHHYYEELFRNGADTIFLCDLDGRFTSVNHAFATLTGYSRLQSAELNLNNLVVSGDEAKVRSMIMQLLGGGSPAVIEVTLLNADGVRITVSISARLMTEMGRPCGFQAFARDVTESRLTQRAMEVVIRDTDGVEGDQFLSTLVSSLSTVIPDCYCFVAVVDKHGVGRTSAFAIDGKLQRNVSHNLASSPGGIVMAEGEYFVARGLGALYPDNDIIQQLGLQSYFGTALPDGNAQKIGIFGMVGLKPMVYSQTIRSVAKLFARRAAVELERADQARQRCMLASLVENSGELIAMADLNGQCFYMNAAGRFLLEAGLDQIGLFHWKTLFSAAEQQLPTLEEIIQQGHTCFEASLAPLTGSAAIPMQLECFLVLDPANPSHLGIAIIGRDLRPANASRTALQESEEKHRTAIAALTEGVLLIDLEGRILAANASAALIFEKPVEALVGQLIGTDKMDFVAEDGLAIAYKDLPWVGKNGVFEPQNNAVIGVSRCKFPPLWLSVNSQPISRRGEMGPHSIVISFTDITEKRQAQRRLSAFSEGLWELHRLNTITTGDQDSFLEDTLASGCRLLGMSHGVILTFDATSQPSILCSVPADMTLASVPLELLGQAQGTLIREASEAGPAISATPVLAGQRNLGVLALFNRSVAQLDNFKQEESEILELIAKVVGRNLLEDLMDRERSEVERELLRSEQQFRSLIEDATDFICVLDPSGVLAYASPSFVRAMHAAAGSWLGVQLETYVLEVDRAAFSAARQRWLAVPGQHPAVEFRFQSTGGEIIYVESVANNLLADSDVLAIVVNSRDITQRRAAEEKMRLLESAIAEARDAIVVVTPHAQEVGKAIIRYANPAMQRLYGSSNDLLAGQPVQLLIQTLSSENRGFLVAINNSIHSGKPAQAVLEIQSTDAGPSWFDVSCEPLLDNSGNLQHCIAVIRNITIQRRAIQLEQERNRILELIGRSAPSFEIMSALALMVERQIPNSFVAVLQLKGQSLSCEAAPSLPPEYHVALNAIGIAHRAGVCWTAIQTRNRATADPALEDEFWAACPQLRSQLDVKKCLAQPIFSATGRVLGVLTVLYHTNITFDRDLDFLNSAANIAGIAFDHRQMTDTLAYQAKHDSLTGLPNRNHLDDLLRQMVERFRTMGKCLGVGFLDLDRFKPINDSLGHSIGDLLLEQVAKRLQSAMAPGEVLARVGGDEFVVLFVDVESSEEAIQHGQRILEKFRPPFSVEGNDLFLTASMGLSLYPRDGTDGQTLLRNADYAMYRAKNLGKNELELYKPTTGSSPAQRLDIESKLRVALEQQELSLNYHQLQTLDGTLYGFEALLVWKHPVLGRISPSDFIPIAEESGLIISIGSWVLEQACLQLAKWLRAGYAISQVSVNVSALQFARPDFVDIVTGALAVSGLDPRNLTLEITESLIMCNLKEGAAKIALLRAVGLGIAIDDFGTGYSSLNYLSQLPVNQLKIDQSFVKEMMSKNTTAYSVVKTITTLARSLRMRVVAEGVEKQEQLNLLRTAGCDLVQGHFFGLPLSALEAGQLLERQKRS